jgi:MFS family permease
MQSLPRLSNRMAVISLILICATYCVNAMDRIVFPVLLPAVAKEYNFALSNGGLLATIFTLGLGLTGIPGGYLFDKMSRKAVAVLGIVIYSICTILTATSIGFWDMAAYRAVSGVGEALQNMAIFTLAGAYFVKNRTLAMAMLNVAYGMGAFIAPRWGSALMVAYDSWRVPLYVFGVVGLVGAVVAMFISKRFTEQVGLVTEQDAANEQHIPDRLINRNTLFLAIATICSGLANFAYLGLYPTFLDSMLHFTKPEIAAAASMYGIGALMAIPFGFLADRVSQKYLQIFAMVLTAASGYAIFNVATTVETQEALSFIMGMAVSGIIYVNGYSLMQRAVRAKIAGRVSGLFVCVFYMSAASSGYIFAQLKGAYGWGDGALIIETLQMGIGIVALMFLDMSKTSANKTSANKTSANPSDLTQPLVKTKVREA